MQVTRRGLLAGAAVGGGLVIAWSLMPRAFPVPLEPGENEHVFGAWLKIAEDGVITVAVPQLEMGQGITTILPQIVAVELGADWRQIAVEPAPPSGAYANIPLAAKWAPLWMPITTDLAEPGDFLTTRFAQNTAFAATADGTALAAYELPCREAAASARIMLAQAAAERWDVTPEECEAEAGFIIHSAPDRPMRRASFAELVRDAAKLDPPELPPLRVASASERPIPGQADEPTQFPRLDLPSKVDGTYLFAGDVRLPDMVYAAIRHGPLPSAKLTGFDIKEVRGNDAILQVVEGSDWLCAVGTNWWAADRALDKMRPRFAVADTPDTAAIEDALDTALREGTGYRIATRGAEDAMFDDPDLALRYDVAPAPHATLETTTATAHFVDGKLRLWLASQSPEHARNAAAEVLGIGLTYVVLYPMPAGGSFDRRLEQGHAIEAALIAREVGEKFGRPVQLIWSREQEMLAPPRTPVAALVTAKLGKVGRSEIAAIRTRIAAPATTHEFGQRLFHGKTPEAALRESADQRDPMACAGALPPYAIPTAVVDHVPVNLRLPTGRMRANAHGYTAFFTESFIDEVAARGKREPLSYRIEMLGQDLRMVACLQRAARLAEWGGGRDQSGQGLACHWMGDAAIISDGAGEFQGTRGRIACIASARLADGAVVVDKLFAAIDIGRIVNLDIARQQIEGGLIFGMGLALGRKFTYARGLPRQRRLAALNLPRLADSPEILVDFIASDAPAFDPGELGAAVVAPAIANALYSASGRRFRSIPFIDDPVDRPAVKAITELVPAQDADPDSETIAPSEQPAQIAPDGSIITDE